MEVVPGVPPVNEGSSHKPAARYRSAVGRAGNAVARPSATQAGQQAHKWSSLEGSLPIGSQQ